MPILKSQTLKHLHNLRYLSALDKSIKNLKKLRFLGGLSKGITKKFQSKRIAAKLKLFFNYS